MGEHLVTVGRKNSLSTRRDFQQKQVQQSAVSNSKVKGMRRIERIQTTNRQNYKAQAGLDKS